MGVSDYISGSVRISVQCRTAERFLNICAEKRVRFSRIQKHDRDTLSLTVSPKGYVFLKMNAPVYGYEITVISKSGAFFEVRKLKKRYFLVTGFVLCLAVLWLSSLFIWEIEVTGANSVNSGKILSALSEMGVGIGTCRLAISQEHISNEMLQKIDGLSFIAVNVIGSKAEVVVREEKEKPEIESPGVPKLVYAAKSGIIEKITALEGNAVCKEGDTVNKNDILVQGVLESVSSGTRTVSASAEITARTWREASAVMPLECYEKYHIERDTVRHAVIFFGKRINLYINSGIPTIGYDRIILENDIRIKNMIFPFKIISEFVSKYSPVKVQLEEETAVNILKTGLMERLREELSEKGKIISCEFETKTENGVVSVIMKSECMERIDETRRLTEEEINNAGKEEKNG